MPGTGDRHPLDSVIGISGIRNVFPRRRAQLLFG
jgi:hypothetical protein